MSKRAFQRSVWPVNGLLVAVAMLAMLAATPSVVFAGGPWVPPPGAQPAGLGGGAFTCYAWTVTVPGGIVPDGGAVHCGSYNPAVAPTGSDYNLLYHTMNVNLYDNLGGWITSFNPPLTFCTSYNDAELYQAGGDVNRFAILNAPIPGSWREIAATVNPSTRMVCANVNALSGTLFELAVRSSTYRSTAPLSTSGASYAQYVVQPGDTIYIIGARYGVTIDAIIAANNLYTTNFHIGQTLNIPVTPPTGTTYTTVGAQARSTSASAGFYYTVRSGDTLYLIASRCSVTVEVLRTVNNLYSGYVYPGQVLWIPYGSTPSYNVTASGYGYSAASASASSGPGYAYASASTGDGGGGRYYIVRTGDTLFRIALNYGSSVEAIRAANGISGNWIYPGQQLIIP